MAQEKTNTEVRKDLLIRINNFCTANNKTAALELSLTLGLFFVLTGLMIWGLDHGYWFTFLPLPLAAALLTRTFTIQHDCGHGSYFTSAKANDIAGCLLGVLTLTPYYYWRKNHGFHHATSGNLDRRGIGDVDTLTVEEYRALSPLGKLRYRVYRHPVFILLLSPVLLFGVKHRLPLDNPFHSVKSWVNIMATNIAIACLVAALIHFFGAEAFFLVYLPVCWLGATLGICGFYIQHQYEDAYWDKNGEWEYFDAGFHGSSYFEFPPIISKLFNDINLHHIHHLNGRIPSYRLRECLNAIAELRAVPKRTWLDVPACFRLALWDENSRKMVGFGAA